MNIALHGHMGRDAAAVENLLQHGHTISAVGSWENPNVVDNFAEDTGLTHQEAEEYVNQVSEDDLVPYDQVGASYTTDGQDILTYAAAVDCFNYKYEWESATLSCDEGKSQLMELGNDEVALGRAYTKLASDSASRADISMTIALLDEVNADYAFEIFTNIGNVAASADIDESKKTNSYNKATLKAALESDQ